MVLFPAASDRSSVTDPEHRSVEKSRSILAVYLNDRRRGASLFDRMKSRYVSAVHDYGAGARGEELMRAGEAAPLESRARWLASQLAICDLPRMVRLDVPWWNRKAALAVDAFLAERTAPRVFEFGSGSSTVWLARRSAEVISAEPHADWAEALRGWLGSYGNTELLVRRLEAGGGPFADSIRETGGEFDLIVIDGRERAACLRACLPFLKSDGIILFDDSFRRRYRPSIEESGLREARFFGPAFAKPYLDWTSVLRQPFASSDDS